MIHPQREVEFFYQSSSVVVDFFSWSPCYYNYIIAITTSQPNNILNHRNNLDYLSGLYALCGKNRRQQDTYDKKNHDRTRIYPHDPPPDTHFGTPMVKIKKTRYPKKEKRRTHTGEGRNNAGVWPNCRIPWHRATREFVYQVVVNSLVATAWTSLVSRLIMYHSIFHLPCVSAPTPRVTTVYPGV